MIFPQWRVSQYYFVDRLLVEILCMFISTTTPDFVQKNIDLRRFILNKQSKFFPDNIRVYAYYNRTGTMKSSGISGLLNIPETVRTFAEIVFPPYGYYMGLESPPTRNDLHDITFFTSYSYNDFVDVSLRLPVMKPHEYLPGRFV